MSVTLLALFVGTAHSKDSCDIFSDSQKKVLSFSYKAGEVSGKGYSLAAIAWRESSAGKRLINWRDPSFGIYHNLIFTVANREGVSHSDDEAMFALQMRLLRDWEFAAKHALLELKYWEKVSGKNNWHRVWASYNGGNNYKSYSAQEYSFDIASKIAFLKANKCVST